MRLEELADYRNWIGKDALEIRSHVIRVGGWTEVFRHTELPLEIHRMRNAFNEPPRSLYRVPSDEAKAAIARVRRPKDGFINNVTADFAFSGDVYKEQYLWPNGKPEVRYWIEQSQAGSRYHSKEQRGLIGSALLPHSLTGNFKMCYDDGTGGSSEVCLHNWMHGLTG